MARTKKVESLKHHAASRKNIPTSEHRAVLADDERTPVQVAYERRNRDLDPQLVWRGKDQQDLTDLLVPAPPLYIQEKVHPKVLIDDLVRHSKETAPADEAIDLFADFNGLPEDATKTEFYQHDANWSNRMILGDSLQVMASLAEREGLRGKVQCIYFDPPYGIKFNSNFQWSTTSRDVKDGNRKHITREPEQVKAFRDTWQDGIHSYLTYLRDRLTIARDLLAESGSIFFQIGDENLHLVRSILDEVYGADNFVCTIPFVRTTGQTAKFIASTNDYILLYAKNISSLKYRRLFTPKPALQTRWYRFPDGTTASRSHVDDTEDLAAYKPDNITSQSGGETTRFPVAFHGRLFPRKIGGWKTNEAGMARLIQAARIHEARNSIQYVRLESDFGYRLINNFWTDTRTGNFTERKTYVVQTAVKVIQRCLLMATDPGDLVLDPTCGAGTSAYVAEQWGRRWITVDTSRVALALARTRIMSARYPYYLLRDTEEGRAKQAAIARRTEPTDPTFGDIRQGFVYERAPHITLRLIANNAEIDVIWRQAQAAIESLLGKLNALLGESWEEWQVPRQAGVDWPREARELHEKWQQARIDRQGEIDASIAAHAPYELLYDRPYEDSTRVRVAGPFTVESVAPHRMLGVDVDEALLDRAAEPEPEYGERKDFAETMLDQLRTAGVQQVHREDRIEFTSLTGWPGRYVCAMGQYMEGSRVRRAGVLIGPEFGTVLRADLAAAARETAEAGFDVLIACAFNYDAPAADLPNLGRIPILKARMNADLHMVDDLKNTGAGNLFVIFGEPDIEIDPVGDGQIQVEIKGVDVFDPSKGEVRSDHPNGIACWFIDTDYNEESFFVRHAYFLGAADPYKSLRTTLRAEIDPDAWDTLRSRVSRPFPRPESGRIAVKVINHLGDEVMKVFPV